MEKLPPETCWAITAKTLTGFVVSRMLKTSTPFLGKDDGILSLLSGWDKEVEIKGKIYGESARKMFPWLKEMFNIPVEDAIEANKLHVVAATLLCGPEMKVEIVEKSPERVVVRWTTCAWNERWFKEFGINPELIPCPETCPIWGEEGLKAIDPQINFKLTTAMPRGDPYCEQIFEFKKE